MNASRTPGYRTLTVPTDVVQEGWVLDARYPEDTTVREVTRTKVGIHIVTDAMVVDAIPGVHVLTLTVAA